MQTVRNPLPTILTALGQLGMAWAHELQSSLAALTDHLAEELVLASDGRWHGPHTQGFAPLGLTLTEALGMSLSVLWAATPGRELVHVEASTAGRWLITLPVVGVEHELATCHAVELVQSLLVIRRILWPVEPWRPHDPVAAELLRSQRLLEAELRGRAPAQPLELVIDHSDIGRRWA